MNVKNVASNCSMYLSSDLVEVWLVKLEGKKDKKNVCTHTHREQAI